jgi:hypothetical protein
MPAKTRSRRVGRPPAGHDGEKVKDYPQLALRIPAEAKAKLQALSLVSARPQWRLLSDAIECYLRARPHEEQRQVRRLIVSPRRKRAAATSRPRSSK